MSDDNVFNINRGLYDYFAPTIPNLEPNDKIIGTRDYEIERDVVFKVPTPFPEKVSFYINGFTLGEGDSWIDFGPRLRKFVPTFDGKKKNNEYILAWDAFAPGDLDKEGLPKMSIRGEIDLTKGTIFLTGRGFSTIGVKMFIWGKDSLG
ncbi:putative prenyltransferase [Kosakonia phage Kc263]|uniref:Prenyltransferase n=1 Tax=Kosakonia phage Kc263 TaxID=2863194 RepID=A0AAE7WFB1_9CAUD|nr:putative prenyltransferase [Kosakonia phage Kc263]QYN80012.1 putative prenyltransferase [Kosakonia phage Kc263]